MKMKKKIIIAKYENFNTIDHLLSDKIKLSNFKTIQFYWLLILFIIRLIALKKQKALDLLAKP